MLLRLLESLTNGILLPSNAPGQKVDYAVYSKEPSQLMKEQLGGVIGPTHQKVRFENSIFLLDKEKITFFEINPSLTGAASR